MSGRGGKRPGAGRPRLNPLPKVNIDELVPDDVDYDAIFASREEAPPAEEHFVLSDDDDNVAFVPQLEEEQRRQQQQQAVAPAPAPKPKGKRGRPPSGKALSAAQRMRQYRAQRNERDEDDDALARYVGAETTEDIARRQQQQRDAAEERDRSARADLMSSINRDVGGDDDDDDTPFSFWTERDMTAQEQRQYPGIPRPMLSWPGDVAHTTKRVASHSSVTAAVDRIIHHNSHPALYLCGIPLLNHTACDFILYLLPEGSSNAVAVRNRLILHIEAYIEGAPVTAESSIMQLQHQFGFHLVFLSKYTYIVAFTGFSPSNKFVPQPMNPAGERIAAAVAVSALSSPDYPTIASNDFAAHASSLADAKVDAQSMSLGPFGIFPRDHMRAWRFIVCSCFFPSHKMSVLDGDFASPDVWANFHSLVDVTSWNVLIEWIAASIISATTTNINAVINDLLPSRRNAATEQGKYINESRAKLEAVRGVLEQQSQSQANTIRNFIITPQQQGAHAAHVNFEDLCVSLQSNVLLKSIATALASKSSDPQLNVPRWMSVFRVCPYGSVFTKLSFSQLQRRELPWVSPWNPDARMFIGRVVLTPISVAMRFETDAFDALALYVIKACVGVYELYATQTLGVKAVTDRFNVPQQRQLPFLPQNMSSFAPFYRSLIFATQPYSCVTFATFYPWDILLTYPRDLTITSCLSRFSCSSLDVDCFNKMKQWYSRRGGNSAADVRFSELFMLIRDMVLSPSFTPSCIFGKTYDVAGVTCFRIPRVPILYPWHVSEPITIGRLHLLIKNGDMSAVLDMTDQLDVLYANFANVVFRIMTDDSQEYNETILYMHLAIHTLYALSQFCIIMCPSLSQRLSVMTDPVCWCNMLRVVIAYFTIADDTTSPPFVIPPSCGIGTYIPEFGGYNYPNALGYDKSVPFQSIQTPLTCPFMYGIVKRNMDTSLFSKDMVEHFVPSFSDFENHHKAFAHIFMNCHRMVGTFGAAAMLVRARSINQPIPAFVFPSNPHPVVIDSSLYGGCVKKEEPTDRLLMFSVFSSIKHNTFRMFYVHPSTLPENITTPCPFTTSVITEHTENWDSRLSKLREEYASHGAEEEEKGMVWWLTTSCTMLAELNADLIISGMVKHPKTNQQVQRLIDQALGASGSRVNLH